MTVIATHEDAKALGYCNAGLRKWFPRDGVSFDDFRRDGVTTDWLRAIGDLGVTEQRGLTSSLRSTGETVGAQCWWRRDRR